jgi:biotin operon repressor
MSTVVARQKSPVAAAGQRAILRSAVANAPHIEALGKLGDSVLLTAIKNGTGIASGAKLAKALRVASHALNRAATLLGSPESESEKRMRAARARGRAFRDDLIANKKVLPSGEFAAALSVSRQALSKAVQSGRLFALEAGGENYYPSFYLDCKVDRRKLERVSKTMGALSGWERWRFFTTPKGSLAGLTPLDALKKGKYEEVLTAATGFAER